MKYILHIFAERRDIYCLNRNIYKSRNMDRLVESKVIIKEGKPKVILSESISSKGYMTMDEAKRIGTEYITKMVKMQRSGSSNNP